MSPCNQLTLVTLPPSHLALPILLDKSPLQTTDTIFLPKKAQTVTTAAIEIGKGIRTAKTRKEAPTRAAIGIREGNSTQPYFKTLWNATLTTSRTIRQTTFVIHIVQINEIFQPLHFTMAVTLSAQQFITTCTL